MVKEQKDTGSLVVMPSLKSNWHKAKHDSTKTSLTFFKRTIETPCISRVSSVCYGREAWCQHSTQPWSLFSIDSQLNAQQYGFSFDLQIAQTLVTHSTICAPRTRAHTQCSLSVRLWFVKYKWTEAVKYCTFNIIKREVYKSFIHWHN